MQSKTSPSLHILHQMMVRVGREDDLITAYALNVMRRREERRQEGVRSIQTQAQ